MTPYPNLPTRQIHLDFHTSPYISNVGADFDAETFADAVEAARVNSITIFAKCHHGMCYYPTRAGEIHPALKGRDLMGEQIEALHRRGIRCPLYVTVGWEEHAAHLHPDWRQLTREGHSIRAEPRLGDELLAGGWYFMNWLHPDYQDLMEAHLKELFADYEVDGIFFDILIHGPGGDWSPEARKYREKHGLTKDDPQTLDRTLIAAQKTFAEKFSRIVREGAKEATVFYNGRAIITTDHQSGVRGRASEQTHYEIESLPTGHWGYYHFPKNARFMPQLGQSWLGMTGRFQKSWGDFGGIKPVPALEYECFRTQALGGAISVGDQLPPNGVFDPASIDLIGTVFARTEAAEPFYKESENHFDIGILSAGAHGCDWQGVQRSESGAVMLCEAARRSPMILDDASAFDSLPAIILPDAVLVTDTLAEKLKAYYENGGSLILSGRSGTDAYGTWKLDFLPFKPTGPAGVSPTYWLADPELDDRWSQAPRVLYSEGMNIKYDSSMEVWIQRVLPWFQRTDARFCSHFQAPPRQEHDPNPALVAGERVLYFADPVFRDFRQSSQVYVKDLWCRAIRRFLGPPLVDTALLPSIEVYPRRRDQDLLLTLLRYLPVRKAMEIDVIDERLPFTGQHISFAEPVESLVPYPEGTPLEKVDERTFVLQGEGRLLLTAPGYFS